MIMKHGRVIRFLISGGSAAATNLTVLYIATEFFHIWYVASSVIGFLISLVVSFTLQKFWTFADRSVHLLRTQMIKYFTVTVTNLCINTLLLYSLVEYAQLHYLIAQIIAMGIIAIESYIIYQRFIFHRPATPEIANSAL